MRTKANSAILASGRRHLSKNFPTARKLIIAQISNVRNICERPNIGATGKIFITNDPQALVAANGMDVVIDAISVPPVGTHHALLAAKHGCKIVTGNVEADALAGPLFARKGKAAGGVYSLAYGDQSALIAEIVDCANSRVQCRLADKSTKYSSDGHESTPRWSTLFSMVQNLESR